ncbi:MAG: type II toxin-antitoxin system RelE/ParE family toxin [Beijerinckiaceae bacterium]
MQHYTVVFTPRAERQLANLYAYVADQSGEARAEIFVDGLVADCLSLSMFPERGIKRDDIRPHLRTKGYARRVTIAFSVNTTTSIVAIHGVFYGGQDFEQLLRDTENDD